MLVPSGYRWNSLDFSGCFRAGRGGSTTRCPESRLFSHPDPRNWNNLAGRHGWYSLWCIGCEASSFDIVQIWIFDLFFFGGFRMDFGFCWFLALSCLFSGHSYISFASRAMPALGDAAEKLRKVRSNWLFGGLEMRKQTLLCRDLTYPILEKRKL